MSNLYNFFAITNPNNIPAVPVIAVFLSIFVFITTLSLSIPQLIHLKKEKNTHNDTKFLSYWIFYVGLLGWMLYGGFNIPKTAASTYANTICAFVQSFVIYYLYKYSTIKKNHKNMALPSLIFTLILNTIVGIISILGLYLKINGSGAWSADDRFARFVSTFFPILTCISFLPQVIKSFETKNFSGMSLYMILLFCINNVGWILLFIMQGILTGFDNLISPLIYQSLSLLIYGMQLQLMIRIKKGKVKPSIQYV
ncbi:hypothetical protein MM26B8_04900 [Mycoplasmopsis meleagridis]|uniref:PQ loop repeat family protein n=1 Tax=Mycoplasmopsis meleagridis ATCC 25294 TaxID=1264554 RepID=A0A0F5H1G2_9BACT|nr:PQ-loop domain-containing transporter [Mycoplasmopsis meleagridis]KKB26702.1 hypothetical protein MMELEA_00840 [Mycoplasmopsis meleagridis ATCC 25294]OAD18182.1 hypothetical protein MM26B8_04900 [Mycoplasmopsis meleagridis]VEU77234.1 PQ loop repeat [Mycoplasmopsis meleagridis]